MVKSATEPTEPKPPDPEPYNSRWALRDWIAAAALFVATAGVVLWQNAHVAVLFDLSYILNTAERIALGQVPYRDFPLAHAPLTFLIQAAIIRFTGRVFFHHVLYTALTSGLGTVLSWRIAFSLLRHRVTTAWTLAILLAAPLIFLGVYCIVPTPEYDCDCGFWLLVALWAFERLDRRKSAAFTFAAGALACVPVFFKQNMGLPFLLTAVGAVVLILTRFFILQPNANAGAPGASHLGTGDSTSQRPSLAAFLAGACVALLAALLALHWTAGLGNYIHWTIEYAGQRRLPALSLMLGVYSDPTLLWTLPCIAVALSLLRLTKPNRVPHPSRSFIARWVGSRLRGVPHPSRSFIARWVGSRLRGVPHPSRGFIARWVGSELHWQQIAAFALLAAPFLFALASPLLYDDADERGDALLALWPLLLLLAIALAVANLFALGRRPTLRAFLPLILLAAIHGTFLSQQLWGSTYGIWPLLILLLAELLAFLGPFAARANITRWFTPALAAIISITLLVCGGFYMASEERLNYASLPDGPPAHSAFPALAGLGTPGPYLPEIDELLRYAQANIPFDDGIVLVPGEEPFYFATGRNPRFPVPFFDPTIDPYSPNEIADLIRARNIRWLIVKTDVQTKEDPTPDRAELMQLLTQEFTPTAQLRGYDVYRR